MKRREKEVAAAVLAVRMAALLCRRTQAAIGGDALQKNDKSPVTLADFGSQALVCRVLSEYFPEDPIIAEEDSSALRRAENEGIASRLVREIGAILPGAGLPDILDWIDRGKAAEYSDRFWTLDPIDGTKGFLRGDHYAVSLALLVGGELEVSALACPNLRLGPGSDDKGVILAAARGDGAYMRSIDGDGEPRKIRVSGESVPSRIRFCESLEKEHSSHENAAAIARRLQIAVPPVRLDSQTKYAVVARGDAEAYLRIPRKAEYKEKIWDHAGGALVVEEAGGRVTDLKGDALDFTCGSALLRNRGIVVSNGFVHDAILEAVSALGLES